MKYDHSLNSLKMKRIIYNYTLFFAFYGIETKFVTAKAPKDL